MHDLEWPFYVKFSLLYTAVSAVRLHTYLRANFLYLHAEQKCRTDILLYI